MLTKQQLVDFFKQSLDGAVIVELDFKSEEHFTATVRSKIAPDSNKEFYSKYVSDWIKKLSVITASNWIVRCTFPKRVRMVYRKSFVCHLSGFNKTKAKSNPSRNKTCRANVDFKVKFISRNTMRNDKYIKEKLNLIISIEFVHTHLVRDMQSYNLLKSTDEINDEFYKYFDRGFNIGNAKYYHELVLMEKEENCLETLSNAMLNPRAEHITYIHLKQRESGKLKTFPDEVLITQKKEEIENSGGLMICYDDFKFIVLMTFTMKRVCILTEETCILFVDTTETPNCNITYFYYPSNIGALPVACALHVDKQEETYCQIYSTVKQAIADSDKMRIFNPLLFVTNDTKEHATAVASVFPNATRLSLRLDICRQVWANSSEDNSSAVRRNRHTLMATFRKMLYAKTIEEVQDNYESIISIDNIQDSSFKSYVQQIWDRRDQWWVDAEHWDINVMEASIMFMKESILQRCKTFSPNLMIDVVANVFESHLNRTIAYASKDSLTVATRTKFLNNKRDILDFGSGIQSINSREYRITVVGNTKKTYTSRLDTYCCDCPYGTKGLFCEHLNGLINKIEPEITKMPELSEEEKRFWENVCSEEILNEVQGHIKQYLDSDEELETNNVNEDDNEAPDAEARENEAEDDDFYYLEVKPKLEKTFDDPLVEEIINSDRRPTKRKLNPEGFKNNYDTSLKCLNNEFRRLNGLFKSNANSVNLEAMSRLTDELKKIKPVERVSFKDIMVELGDDEDDVIPAKRSQTDDDDD